MSNKAINNNKPKNKPKVIVILGPTASGKTSLGVKLAAKLNGEIISADSRQVFCGMDIGTGKDLKEFKVDGKKIKHHLIDVVSPKDLFDLASYQKLAFKAIDNVIKRGKLPIIVGGSGLYLQAIVDNYVFGSGKPNYKRRDEIEKLEPAEILEKIAALKPEFAAHINYSDSHNKRRLARYLEIVENGESIDKKKESPYDFLLLGLDFPDDILRQRIEYRLLARFEEGMIAEVKGLLDNDVSAERLKSFGLEYRFITEYLEGVHTYHELVKKLGTAIYRFAKKQKNWFRRWQKQGRKINWVKDQVVAEKLIEKFFK